MADIHVAAGLPPGHSDALFPCICRPIAFMTTGGGTIVIHRIAAPEMLRPEYPEASHALNTRVHGTRQDDETGAPWGEAWVDEPCAREGCGHARSYHWGNADDGQGTQDRYGGYCTYYPGTTGRHCPGHQTRDRNAKADPGALPDPAPQHG